jgi:tricorn protease interacting factor F2/3
MKPTHYSLHLEPDLKSFLCPGSVVITLHSSESISSIVLNSKDLEISQCLLAAADSDHSEVCSFQLIPEKEELRIILPKSLSGQIKIKISFIGKIHDDLLGLYRSHYEERGQTKYIAVTQFEEREARRVFPCIDHPAYKAVFDVEFVVANELRVIGNTPIIAEEKIENGKKRIRLATTPKMCTYILFFGIGNFEEIVDRSKKPVLRVLGPPGRVQYGQFGLDMGRKSLDFCEEYMQVPYPLDKMDHIAVADFAFGAMENWGAITYRENLLLVYPGKTSKPGLVRLASVIAHETSHMWFGNLVSPADWKYLWLNESFASYFTYAVPDKYYPDWQMWDQFILQQIQPGMERDSLSSTVPIELPGEAVINIDSSSAPIIYNKGASILRMLVDFMGEDKYRTGIRHYMEKYKYDIASSGQFWDALEEATDIPVKKFAESWVHQPGYPLIQVEWKTDTEIVLTQKRFVFPNSAAAEQSNPQVWLIPIKLWLFSEHGEVAMDLVMDQSKMEVTIPEATRAFKLNIGQHGFYRVQYKKDEYEMFIPLILAQRLSAIDRYGIEYDAFALVRQGNFKLTRYLDMLERGYLEENGPLALIDIAGNLRLTALLNVNFRSRIHDLGVKICERVLDLIGLEPKESDSVLTIELRSSMLWTGYLFGSQIVRDFITPLFADYLAGKAISPEILGTVLRIGIDYNSEAINELKSRILSGQTPEPERLALITALGQVQSIPKLTELLEFGLEKIAVGNRYVLFASVSSNPISQGFLWDWFTTNYSRVMKAMPPALFDRVILAIVPIHAIGKKNVAQKLLSQITNELPYVKDVVTMALEELAVYERLANS